MLLDLDGFPVTLPTRYSIDRFDRLATNTKIAVLRAIESFYSWANQQTQRLDLESRLRSTHLLTSAELASFSRFLRARRRSGVVPLSVGDIGPHEGITVLSNNTFNTYWLQVTGFILWAARFIASISSASKEYEALKKRLDLEMLGWTRRPQRYGLTTDQDTELFKFVHPDNPANPFNVPVRFRNYLIVRLIFETGIRRGEACKLRLQDLHLRGSVDPHIEVRRRPNDRLDPRANEPQVKTRERIIPIRSTLQEAFITYTKKYRGMGVRHPYLFTNPSDGQPISLGTVNYIFSRIRATNPELAKIDLTPHIGRHTFEGNLLETAEQLGWPETKTDRVQKMISGWSETSNQPANYTARKTAKDAFELIRKIQDKANDFQ